LFAVAWIVDFVILAPLSEFLLDHANLPVDFRIPLRATVAFAWLVLGYTVGAEMGIFLRSRHRRLWAAPIYALAVLYVAAMPTIAFFMGQGLFEGAERVILMPMALASSSIPIVSGYFFSTAVEYLNFLRRLGQLDRAKQENRRQQYELSRDIVERASEMAQAQDEHQREFSEQVQPRLTDLATELIREASQGRIVTATEAEVPSAGPALLPTGAPRAETQTAPTPAHEPPAQNGQAQASTEEAVGQAPAVEELAYLRQQLEAGALQADAGLTSANVFTRRLP
ncbi:MAG: hypothetical protein ACP5U2_17820, partial [Bryobacteraceae bacterium]